MTLKEAISLLKSRRTEDAAYDARVIFENIGGYKKEELVASNPTADEKTESAIRRRLEREPLQYILGTVDFFRETYEVSPDCLIPRQETELLVEAAVKLLPKGASFIDLCTGSGCIAISVLKNTENTTATATDISEKALAIAKKNAERNGVTERISFKKSDASREVIDGDFFAVISNPPYVTKNAFSSLAPEIAFEPQMAFVGGGDDGAGFYRAIVALWHSRIPKDGFILFEIGFDQGDVLSNIAKEHSMSCKIYKDYSGLDRIALLRRA